MPDRDSEQNSIASLGARVRSIEDTFKHFLDTTFKTYLEQDAAWKTVMAAKLDAISRPNIQNLIGVLGLVFVVGFAVLQGVNGKIESNDRRGIESDIRHTKESEKLDDRLQREYRLMNDTVKSEIAALNALSKERHDTAMAAVSANQRAIVSVESWDKEKTKYDLEELRQRRMRDGSKP